MEEKQTCECLFGLCMYTHNTNFSVFLSTVSERDPVLYLRGTPAVTVLCSLTHTRVAPLALSMEAAVVSKAVHTGNPTFLTLSIH